MFEKFASFTTPGPNENIYGGRKSKYVRANYEELYTEVQKFRETMRRVKARSPTGCTDKKVLSMEIAIQLGKRATILYDKKGTPTLVGATISPLRFSTSSPSTLTRPSRRALCGTEYQRIQFRRKTTEIGVLLELTEQHHQPRRQRHR